MPLVLRPPSRRDSLPDTLHDLGRARRAASVAAGLFTLAALTAAAVTLACALDAWLGLPPLGRAAGLVGTLAATSLVWFRRVVPGARLRTDPLAVALDLEAKFPRFNDALASAVSFLGQDEGDRPPPGSTRLRAAALNRARRLAEKHDFRTLVPSGRCWRAFWLAAAAGLTAAVLAVADPGRAAVAAVRLADPFGPHPWPPRTSVTVAFPARVAVGDAFTVRIEVRGERPERATVEVRPAAGGEFAEGVPLPPDADDPVNVVARFEPGRLTADFTFRVVADDGDTGWQAVSVAPPPKLVPLDGRPSPLIHADYPAYTRLPPTDLSDGGGVVEAPHGTRLTLRAAADVPLASAAVVYLGDKSAVERAAGLSGVGLPNPLAAVAARSLADAVGRDVPVTLSADRRRLDVAFTPSMAGLHALRLTDDTGLTGTRLLELRLQPDPAPTASLVRPAPGRDPAAFTPEAAVPVEVRADDRVYGVRRAFLEYRLGREGVFRELALHDGPALTAASLAVGGASLLAASPPTAVEARTTVPVARFTHPDGGPARDGDVLTLRAAADDWDDVSPAKAPGRSAEVELRIASRGSVEATLQRDLAALRGDLLRAREQQREARQKATEAAPPAGEPLRPEDRDRLAAAEQLQRQVRAKVADGRDGLRAKADQLRATARANGLPRSPTTDRVEATADDLGRLADRDLTAVEPLLGEARQSPPAPASDKRVADLLARADRHQKAVEDGFNRLLERLEQWGGAAEVRGEARLLRDAASRPTGTPPAGSPDALSPAQRSALEKAAGKLDQLAEQAGATLAKAGRLADAKDARARADAATAAARDAEADIAAKGGDEARADALRTQADAARQSGKRAAAEAEALRAAVPAAGGQALPDDLRKAADALRGNKPGEADAARRSAAARLDELADALAEKPPEPDGGLRKKDRTADRVDALADAQDRLREAARDADRIADPAARADELRRLAREQDRLREQARDVLEQLTRRKPDAARDVREALDRMDAARDDLDAGAVPAGPQAEATDRLERARDRLDKAEAEADRELAAEKRRKLADLARAVRDRQAAAAAEADRVRDAAAKAKAWPRPLQQSLVDLAAREATLAGEVRALSAKHFDKLPVLTRLLADAADAMAKAGERAKERVEDVVAADPGDPFDAATEAAAADRVRRPMALALKRLDQLLDALKPDEPKPTKPPPGDANDPPPADAGGGGGEDGVPPLAQLKVLRALQAELNERTANFANAHPRFDALSDEDRDELKELEQAQRDIAALVEGMADLFPRAEEKP